MKSKGMAAKASSKIDFKHMATMILIGLLSLGMLAGIIYSFCSALWGRGK